MKILLIEDDDALIALLTHAFSSQHYVVDVVKDGETGWDYASTFDYGLIILDIMLPLLDGISLCRKLRGEGYTTPILLLTAQDNTTAKVQGLDAGADDYVVKPFDIAELIARVRALWRRGSNNPLPLLSWGDLLLNPSTCDVRYNGQALTLTTKEYDLLELLLRDSCQVFSNNEIIDRLWSSDAFPTEATVRSHLRRLRHKLQAAGAPPDLITTIHGRGYYLKSPSSSGSLDIHNYAAEVDHSDQLNSPLDQLEPIDQTEQQQQYFSFLQKTWVTTKPQCLERLRELMVIVDRLLLNQCSYAEQQAGHQLAHKLVGTLGVFSWQSAMKITRHIENLLDRSHLLSPAEVVGLPNLVAEVVQEIEVHALPTQNIGHAGETLALTALPLLLLVDVEPTMTQTLTAMSNVRSMVLSTLTAAEEYLLTVTLDSFVLLVGCFGSENGSRLSPALPDFIVRLRQRWPEGSVLVLSDGDDFSDRLTVVRHGGKFLCTTQLNTKQIYAAISTCLKAVAPSLAKVMVVDDDLDWLRALPKLLKPWGLKVTTLADLKHFWTVLQLVSPDVLVLDVKMPEINGLELCQLLRCDPVWQNLPILFLTSANSPNVQQEAFQVGADDYLCKPMMGGEIAQRIRHRLTRLQTGQVAT
jgi:DNA-binding response OmpR family regulator